MGAGGDGRRAHMQVELQTHTYTLGSGLVCARFTACIWWFSALPDCGGGGGFQACARCVAWGGAGPVMQGFHLRVRGPRGGRARPPVQWFALLSLSLRFCMFSFDLRHLVFIAAVVAFGADDGHGRLSYISERREPGRKLFDFFTGEKTLTVAIATHGAHARAHASVSCSMVG